MILSLLDVEIIKNKKEIVNVVRERWKQGLRPSGGIIGTYRSFLYQREKIQQNPLAGGNVDLILTGALEKGLDIFKHGNGLYTIFSTDSKAVDIASKYGLDVYGLTKDEQIMFVSEALLRVNYKIVQGL